MSLEGVSKAYPGVKALNALDIDFVAGEIHGIVGQNGAGKSTLIKIVSGVTPPSEGILRLHNEEVTFSGSREAIECGVAVVHQEFQSLMGMSVIENVLLGGPVTRRIVVDWAHAASEAESALNRVGLLINVHTKMEKLTPAQRKLVEIARAMYLDSTLLLLDEPTAALESADSEVVIECMRHLRDAGRSVVFISHHLGEVLACCDRVTVLRDGSAVGTYPVSSITTRHIVDLMVGSEFADVDLDRSTAHGEPMLELERWCVQGKVDDVSLSVRAGEVVGLAGLIGSGRSELAQSIFGAVPHTSGNLWVDGQSFNPRNPAEAIKLGIAYVPSDRQTDGIIFSMDLRQNISLAILRLLRKRGGIDHPAEAQMTRQIFDRLRVKANGLDQYPETLSGGNQQKVLLGRWLASDPKVIILDEPTQGIDIAAKAEVHKLVSELAEAGMAVLMISSDLGELVALCDRTLVMRHGVVVTEFDRGVTEPELIMAVTSAEENDA